MSKLNNDVLSHIEDDTLTYHICRGIKSTMSVNDFESNFGLITAASPTHGEHTYYYRHYKLTELIMKITIANGTINAVFGTEDLFENELKPILNHK